MLAMCGDTVACSLQGENELALYKETNMNIGQQVRVIGGGPYLWKIGYIFAVRDYGYDVQVDDEFIPVHSDEVEATYNPADNSGNSYNVGGEC